MTTPTLYTGSCHCGAVAFEATMALDEVMACNCSICSRAGYLLAFVPGEAFTLLRGEGELTDYTFNKHHIHHSFCKTCGVRAFGHGATKDGGVMYAVNARCLDGVDPSTLSIKHVDGRSL